ncbi:class I SAM-dependent DNA methyltransferase [Alkalihalobacillus trypoxylicola]|uniref:Methyltransferase n=1 Tax=Alkalihalobacillus trypoxylicola TaxID=519424 RepID=A0A161PGU1_9BACI|nr:class I SAM-dependent methyltransferase [Alkalihalobacillus trypoxylicola]KYG32004.1 methyltransferase [Alkalihalobacillus trypoxylicola]
MNYMIFAALYDHLMSEAPYDRWLDYVKNNSNPALKGLDIMDVGCGTGEMVIRYGQEGANVTGIDLSSEMLLVAKEKTDKLGLTPFLIEQDMASLPFIGEFDVITVFCDSLNYLKTETDVKSAFTSFFQQLKTGGMLLFDVHSPYKITNVYSNQTFADDGDEISYIWNSFEGKEVLSIEHELTFFVKNEDNLYQRHEELHFQRTYPIANYKEWLEEIGFVVEKIEADFRAEAPCEESERIFFKAVKK